MEPGDDLERWPIDVPVSHNREKQRPHASDDVRERALAAGNAGHPVADGAECFHNDPSTIRCWIRLAILQAAEGQPRCAMGVPDELMPRTTNSCASGLRRIRTRR